MPFREDHLVETYKSLVLISIEGLKALLLINGGAVVALLAFLGQSSLGPAIAPRAWEPNAWFLAGTAFATTAFLGSYATQFALYNERVPTNYRGPRHMSFLFCTVACVVLSLGCFGAGSFSSLRLFAAQVPASTPIAAAPASTPPASGVPVSQPLVSSPGSGARK